MINDFLNQIGYDNIIYLAQRDKDLVSLLKPEVLAAYKAKAAQHAWIASAITRQDVVNMLDPELLNRLGQEPNGAIWLGRQLDFLQSIFGG